MHFLRLFHRYIIRDLFKNRTRLALTISGVALGISVVVAVELANERAIGSFNNSLRTLAGQADLEITGNGLPLDEDLVSRLKWLWDYGAISPVIEGRGILVQDPVRIFGVDLLSEAAFRQYVLRDRAELTTAIASDEFLDLLLDPQEAVITETLARRFHLERNSRFQLTIRDRRRDFRVGAILMSEGVARAFSGDVVFLDIAAAQLALGRVGNLDRLDIQLRNKKDVEEVRERIHSLLPVNAVVDVPESSAIRNEKLLRAFRYNLTALSYISLIVGIILIYNALTIAVVRRRAEIAMLRTLGISRSTIAGLFVLEAGLVGLIGAAIGIGFGELLSRIAGVLVTRTIESLYTGFAAVATAGIARPGFYAEILAMGVVLSIASGIAPALRATGIAPVAVLREGMVIAGRPWRTFRVSVAGLAVIVLAVIVGRRPPLFGFPILGYVSALLLIVGFGLLARPVSQILLRAVSPPLKKIFPIEGRLAAQSMRSSIGRIVTAVAALAIAVAMLISVATMVSSFRDTVRVWIDQTLRADLYIRAAAAGANDWSNPFDPETVDALAHLPRVAAIDRFRGRPLNYKGSPIVVAAGEFAVMANYGNLLFLDGRKSIQIAPRMLNQNRVVVSEPFAIKQNMRKGSIITIPTGEGIQPFEIEGVYYDYSNDQGMIVMDRSTYIRLFHDTSVTNIAAYLKPDADIYQMQQQIAESLPNAQLRVLTNSALRQQVLRVFDQTFQVTYGLEGIALIVAILGITNILSALILERRAELAMLRFLGTDKRQLRNIVVLESGLIGLIGSALGFILGIALSVVLIFVINKQSFGWTIQFALPVAFFAQSMILIILATILAGFYPAALAVRMDPIQSVRAE